MRKRKTKAANNARLAIRSSCMHLSRRRRDDCQTGARTSDIVPSSASGSSRETAVTQAGLRGPGGCRREAGQERQSQVIRRRRQEEEVTADDFQWQRGTVLSGSERSGCPDSSLRQRNVQGRIRGRRVAGRLGWTTCLAACHERGRHEGGTKVCQGGRRSRKEGKRKRGQVVCTCL